MGRSADRRPPSGVCLWREPAMDQTDPSMRAESRLAVRPGPLVSAPIAVRPHRTAVLAGLSEPSGSAVRRRVRG